MDTFTQMTILTGIVIIIVLYFRYLVFPLLKGAPFVPMSKSNLRMLVKLADITSEERVVDLGSGDGRVVMEFAELGCKVDGFEINPLLVRSSRKKIKERGLEKTAVIFEKDFWDHDLSEYDIVVLFQVPYVLNKLEKKLKRELKPGSKVLSYSFKFPNWEAVDSRKNIYLYRI